MKLNNLPKIKTKKAKRVGRGAGSGKGKTSGAGTKGQNARGHLPLTHPHYEGGQRPLFKRLPYKRGKGNSPVSKRPVIVNVGDLNKLPKAAEVTLETLIKARIVKGVEAKIHGVKILAEGKLEHKLTVLLPISKSAAKKVEKAGGQVISH